MLGFKMDLWSSILRPCKCAKRQNMCQNVHKFRAVSDSLTVVVVIFLSCSFYFVSLWKHTRRRQKMKGNVTRRSAKIEKTVNQKSDKVSGDKMFQAINLNYYCKHLGFYVHSKHITVFSLLSWMEKMHAPQHLSLRTVVSWDREY